MILQNEDYYNREELVGLFEADEDEINRLAENEWDEVNVAIGIADYDESIDNTVIDTMRRADKIMYENKRSIKGAQD